MSMNRRQRNRRGGGPFGMTLVEVLLAMLLMAIILPAAMRGIDLALNLGSRSRERAVAIGLARQKLNEVLVTGSWRFENGVTGTFEDPMMNKYQWTLESGQWSQNDLLQEIDVTVTWTAKGYERFVSLGTLIDPNSSLYLGSGGPGTSSVGTSTMGQTLGSGR